MPMDETTPNLDMPYILPSQAQKHVTHNEALQRLDALTQLVIEARLAAPPASVANGTCFEVAAAPTGDWSGKAGKLALMQDGAWIFITPRAGWRAVFLADRRLRMHDGSAFQLYDAVAGIDRLGINAAADTANRLAVSSDATLFSHVGRGHQLKINKKAADQTASLLFQDNFSGRAELGLAGSDAFTLKVSADGSTWLDALKTDGSGRVFSPQRPLVRASPTPGTRSPADGSQTGFSTMSVSQGGFALGAAVTGGGNMLVVPATAMYLVVLRVDVDPASAFSVALRANGTTTLATVREADPDAAQHGAEAIGLALLAAGDRLSLLHAGNAAITFGPDRTEVIIAML
jgi:hypothetical protein